MTRKNEPSAKSGRRKPAANWKDRLRGLVNEELKQYTAILLDQDRDALITLLGEHPFLIEDVMPGFLLHEPPSKLIERLRRDREGGVRDLEVANAIIQNSEYFSDMLKMVNLAWAL